MKKINRRQFVAATAALGAVAAFPAPALIARGANEAIRFGLVGCGGRSAVLGGVVQELPGMDMVSVCDPDAGRLDAAKKKYGVEKAFADMRRVFDDPNVDAVFVATCNHWHCLASIWAMQAGKDVYCEKPLCLSFWEGQQIVNAAKKYGRFCQIGTQMRSDPVFHPEVKKFLHEDQSLGKILAVRVNRFCVRRPIGLLETPLVVPPSVDYNLWLGPAKELPLYRSKLQYDWHWMWNTGNGEMGNWGAHLLDDCRNDILQDKVSIPKRVMCMGGRVGYRDAGDTPNTALTYFDTGDIPVVFGISGLEDKKTKRFSGAHKGPDHGYVAYCEGGRYEKHWGGSVAFDKDGKEMRVFTGTSEFRGAYPHIQNFVDSIRANDPAALSAQIEVGYNSSFWYNAANMAYRLGVPYSKAEVLDLVGKTGKPGCFEEVLGELETHLGNNDVTMDGNTFRRSPFMELDPVTKRFVGEKADEANAFADMRPGRGEFVVPEITL